MAMAKRYWVPATPCQARHSAGTSEAGRLGEIEKTNSKPGEKMGPETEAETEKENYENTSLGRLLFLLCRLGRQDFRGRAELFVIAKTLLKIYVKILEQSQADIDLCGELAW
jgi:hypothetical protein